jgi:hypothetical protein
MTMPKNREISGTRPLAMRGHIFIGFSTSSFIAKTHDVFLERS